jgi:hypothetical protein
LGGKGKVAKRRDLRTGYKNRRVLPFGRMKEEEEGEGG